MQKLINSQKQFFAAGQTKDIAFRLRQLQILKKAVAINENEILEALKKDLRKPEFEAYAGEVGLCLSEINFALKNTRLWAKPKKVPTPLMHFPARSVIYPEPYGVTLIISPWNYPFLLAISPLIGAISAGNCCIIKPSEFSIHTSGLLAKIISEYFSPEYIAVVEGGVKETQILLSEKFDYILFTGSTLVGKIVAQAAAKRLTPVTLELGGKSPCIVDQDTNIGITAKRIVWGKFFNAGQTCIAPDYLLVHKSVKDKLLAQIKKTIADFYGIEPVKSPYYARIINEKHFSRLSNLLSEGDIIIGGDINKDKLYIAPTVIDNVNWDHKIMADEIFGPILPVLEYGDLDDAVKAINEKPKPLALYFFSNNKANQEKILRETSSGGVCINDTMNHISSPFLPFGGVGASGTGAYHGKAGFDTFTHYKSVFKKPFALDMSIKYPPYKLPLKYLKKLMK